MFINKIVCLSLAVSAVAVVSSYAATISITNLLGGATNVVVDNSGNLLGPGSTIPGNSNSVSSSGVAAVGTFAISNAAIQGLTSGSALVSAFTQFGTNTVAFGTQVAGFAGVFEGDVDGGDRAAVSGSNAYIVIGNGSSLATSSEFLVYDSGVVFSSVPLITPTNLSLNSAVLGSTLVIGALGNEQIDFGAGEVGAFSTVVLVPEPTSVTLIALGSFAFLLRRRR